jgi:mRNA-degrading endonuclease toxin of MazEF toxin-antitoxin module
VEKNKVTLQSAFDDLLNSIMHKDEKRQGILATWISTWSKYLQFEDSFQPERLMPYKRGMVLLVNLGFNIGSETGGTRYVVVVENNNNPKNNTIVVVPISSLTHGKRREKLHHSEVYIGRILENDETESYAKVLQIRAISKLRIIKPKSKDDKPIRLSAQVMDEIDAKISECFLQNPPRKS